MVLPVFPQPITRALPTYEGIGQASHYENTNFSHIAEAGISCEQVQGNVNNQGNDRFRNGNAPPSAGQQDRVAAFTSRTIPNLPPGRYKYLVL